MIVAVAMDSREGDPLPWIEAARPTYVTLIDRDHRLAELYHMVNVPQAVWIDEDGRIVRPPETAGAYEGFRQMNRQTREMPEEGEPTERRGAGDLPRRHPGLGAARRRERARLRRGGRAGPPRVPTEDTARAHAMFRLGQFLLRRGEREEGDRWLQEASRLHPESWCIWRQGAEVNPLGLASPPEFWTRVDALGERRYYTPPWR